MIEIKAMDESYIHIDCMHGGPVDPELPPRRQRHWFDAPDLPPHPWSDETIAWLAVSSCDECCRSSITYSLY